MNDPVLPAAVLALMEDAATLLDAAFCFSEDERLDRRYTATRDKIRDVLGHTQDNPPDCNPLTPAATTLKPCPFCGSAASLTGLGYCGPADCYDVAVVCDECDARGATLVVDQNQPEVSEIEAEVAAEAVAAWNRRMAA